MEEGNPSGPCVAARRLPRSLRPAICSLAGFAACLLLPAGVVFAQESARVEEPDWNHSAEAPVTLEEELTQPSTTEAASPRPPTDSFQTTRTPGRDLSPSNPALPTQRYQDRAIQDMERRMLEPALDDPDLGEPVEDNWNLPYLTSAADPFFQMEGLKIRIGEIHLRFALTTSFSYDDNIYNSNRNRVGDYITRITPSILVGIGDFKEQLDNYFLLSYRPQPEFFASQTQQNTVNEDLSITGQYAFSRLVTTAAFLYRRDSNPNEDEVGRNENSIYDFTLNNSYALTGKTFFETGLSASYRDYERSIDYTTVSMDVGIAYQYSPKTRISLAPYAGITFVDGGGEQPFQGLNLSVSYDTLKRFSMRGSVGVQARQFEGPNPSGQEDYITPTFSLGASYQLGRSTTIDVSLARTVGNSGIVRGQSLITNRAAVGITQRILSKFILSLDARYDILQYQGSGTNDRTDTYLVLRPRLGYEFWREQCEVSLFYERRDRTSELEYREFYSNTFGASFTTRF